VPFAIKYINDDFSAFYDSESLPTICRLGPKLPVSLNKIRLLSGKEPHAQLNAPIKAPRIASSLVDYLGRETPSTAKDPLTAPIGRAAFGPSPRNF
jgi:hypothetical protein